MALCWASSLASPEEAEREFSDRILAIPNAEKVLNSVLGQIEHNRQVARQRFLQETECDEVSSNRYIAKWR